MLNIDEIILHYLDGSINQEERTQLYHWLIQSESNRSHFYELRNIWLTCDARLTNNMEAGMAFDKFSERVMALQKPDNNNFRGRIPTYQIVRIAASIVLLFSIGYVFLKNTKYFSDREVINCLLTAEGSKGQIGRASCRERV